MLSARTVFEEIFDNDEAFQLFCSIAAAGESQGGWENGRIAALIPESCQDLAPKVARHGADEDKHGRIFTALLRKRGLPSVPVPPETDYTMRLENAGLGVAHSRLRRGTEQMHTLYRCATARPDISRAVRVISHDEDNHLAYCQEELLRLAAAGHAESAALAAGIGATCAYERLGGWRRMVSLQMPARRDALGTPAREQAGST